MLRVISKQWAVLRRRFKNPSGTAEWIESKDLCINSADIKSVIKEDATFKLAGPLDFTLRSQCSVVKGFQHKYQPTHFGNNSWNEFQAVKARVLCKTPTPNPTLLKYYDKVVMSNFNVLFPGMRHIKSVPFDEYLQRSNAKPGVKKVLAATKERLDLEGINEHSVLTKQQLYMWTKRSAFIKVENALYRTPAGTKVKAPRLISGAQPEFICLVGPWIMAVQDKLKQRWNIRSPITFSSGLNGEAMGKWAEINANIGEKLEDDVGKFDASCGEELLTTEAKMFDRMGAPCATRQLIHANISTHGKTRFGIKYKCKGGRKSGDPYTSLGNSIINALTHLVAFMIMKHCTVKQALSSLRMLVQGDDSVILHRGDRLTRWKSIMSQFGFEAEASYRDHICRVNFCSGRFIQVADGLILSPRPGRVLMKFGCFVTANTQDVSELISSTALGHLYNLHHIPAVPRFLEQFVRGGTVRARPNEWEVWLKKRHQFTAETIFWLQDQYYDWPDYCPLPVVDSHWERVFEMDTDGPTVFYHKSS
jgi:hypothetical protein